MARKRINAVNPFSDAQIMKELSPDARILVRCLDLLYVERGEITDGPIDFELVQNLADLDIWDRELPWVELEEFLFVWSHGKGSSHLVPSNILWRRYVFVGSNGVVELPPED